AGSAEPMRRPRSRTGSRDCEADRRASFPRRIERPFRIASMAAPVFIHLRLHSEYSVADGTLRIADAVAAAASDAMPAVAITDLAKAFRLVKFYKAARANGIKPIFGCDTGLTQHAERGQAFPARLIPHSPAGCLKL